MDNKEEVKSQETNQEKPTPFLKRMVILEQKVSDIGRKVDSIIKSLRK